MPRATASKTTKTIKKVKGKTSTTAAFMAHPSIMDQIQMGFSTHTYKFYLMEKRSPNGGGHNQQLLIEGNVQEKGTDWIRVRASSGYRAHTDHIVPLSSILYFTETFRGEG